ncbi:MAG: hypothetical protein H7Z11_04180 [Verrucomicrobia bacterium]|nr:hypothetical protein [Leptolyngbya sp. ES-bin-22]
MTQPTMPVDSAFQVIPPRTNEVDSYFFQQILIRHQDDVSVVWLIRLFKVKDIAKAVSATVIIGLISN